MVGHISRFFINHIAQHKIKISPSVRASCVISSKVECVILLIHSIYAHKHDAYPTIRMLYDVHQVQPV